MSTEQGAEIAGYDRLAVEQWITRHIPSLQPPFTWVPLQGGQSNLTCQILAADGQRVVIRRPPLGTLLPKAHDMAREWAALTGLGPTRVPVPQPLGFCEDPAVTGAHFYVMRHVDGHPLYNVHDAERWAPPHRRIALGHSYIDVLAELHALDPDAVGLGALGKKEGYVARQLNTWYRSWTASVDDAQLDDPRMHALRQYLQAHIPEQGPARVVHGDFGLHNTLIGADSTVAAVVDWELATLGDPLADLAFAISQWYEPGDPPETIATRQVPPTTLPGFPTRHEMTARYAQCTGRDLSGLDFYLAFNQWRFAAQAHGVYARYRSGKKVLGDFDMVRQKRRILGSLGLAEAAMERLERGSGQRWGEA